MLILAIGQEKEYKEYLAIDANFRNMARKGVKIGLMKILGVFYVTAPNSSLGFEEIEIWRAWQFSNSN